jgi:Flp pilus assembly protein TadD
MSTRKTHREARRGPARAAGAIWLAAALLAAVPAAGRAGPPSKGAEPSPPPPDVPDGTVSLDLSRATDSMQFRKNPTPAQRIHTHLDLGRVFEKHGNYEAALMEYQQGLAACEKKWVGRNHSPDEALAHRRLGNVLDRLGRFAQAELHYKQAIRCSPRDPKVWNDAGYSYYLQGRWTDAERTLKTASKLAPEDSRIQTNLGLALAAAGRTKEALPMLSQYSGDAIGHANLGYLLAATGQVELARQQYRQALALRPNLALAQRALAQLDRAAEASAVAARGLPTLPPGTSDATVRRTAATAPARNVAPRTQTRSSMSRP